MLPDPRGMAAEAAKMENRRKIPEKRKPKQQVYMQSQKIMSFSHPCPRHFSSPRPSQMTQNRESVSVRIPIPRHKPKKNTPKTNIRYRGRGISRLSDGVAGCRYVPGSRVEARSLDSFVVFMQVCSNRSSGLTCSLWRLV